jgi:hypothetical protein
VASKLTVLRIPHMNTIVIRQLGDKKFFVATSDAIVIDMFGLSSILKFLLVSGMMSPRVLEGVLGEYYDAQEH